MLTSLIMILKYLNGLPAMKKKKRHINNVIQKLYKNMFTKIFVVLDFKFN